MTRSFASSSRGRLYWMKVYQLPEASRGARGRPIVNLLPLEANERITAILPVREYEEGVNVFMATASGTVKKTALTEFSRPRSAGIIAVNLNEGDELIGVDLTSGSDEVMLFSAAGKVVRFKENAVRAMGRTATGVRGIKLAGEDSVVSLIVPRGEGAILTVTQNGYGKRTAESEYPTKSRGTQGVISIKVTERNGSVVGAVQVDDADQIMMITDAGTLVRTRVSEISVVGRNTCMLSSSALRKMKTSSVCNALLSRWMTKSSTLSTAASRKGMMKSPRKRTSMMKQRMTLTSNVS